MVSYGDWGWQEGRRLPISYLHSSVSIITEEHGQLQYAVDYDCSRRDEYLSSTPAVRGVSQSGSTRELRGTKV